jgi:hypothetical protein
MVFDAGATAHVVHRRVRRRPNHFRDMVRPRREENGIVKEAGASTINQRIFSRA